MALRPPADLPGVPPMAGAAAEAAAQKVKVKICGVTEPAAALLAAELGADYLGLNFWPGSPRCLAAGHAREIAAAVRASGAPVALVGVFVNQPRAEIEEIAAGVGLDLLQFSGEEDAASVRPFAARAIKVFHGRGDPGLLALSGYEDAWGLLLDAPRGSAGSPWGGSGSSWDYGAAPLARLAGRRVFLAGGLGPDNVRRVVADVRPYAIDVCSRVESAPGIKDPRLLRRLFEEVNHGQALAAS
jgi:phosphoribosylanthranilate isomerase